MIVLCSVVSLKLPLMLEAVKEHITKRFNQKLLINYSDAKVCDIHVCAHGIVA